MFGAIAPRYDLLNHLLSLNRDKAWRRRAVDLLLDRGSGIGDRGSRIANQGSGIGDQGSGIKDQGSIPQIHGVYLDSCAGTLDLSVELASRSGFRGSVVAADFTFDMLALGAPKVRGKPVLAACADALQLPFSTGQFAGAMVGFGVRNLASIEAGFAEFARVLRPGARLVVLEFTTPARQPLRGLYLFYFRKLLPLIGRAISGHGGAYTYLPESVLQFPEPLELARRMEAAGFSHVSWQTLTGGIVAIHVGTR
jgi:demethylmenaquinone methyltransferase / 2-methoxy-6-polyprenyl-1,4-benzoquinol methylase